MNGALQASTNWVGDLVLNTALPSRIGTEGGYFFAGAIDEVMVFQRPLTEAQVQTIYESADPPSTNPPSTSQPFTISRLQATSNFAQTNADSCTIKGSFVLPSNYNFIGSVITLNVGGAQVGFTLDSKGKGVNGSSQFTKPSYSRNTGRWTFNATLRNGSWQSSWTTMGWQMPPS